MPSFDIEIDGTRRTVSVEPGRLPEELVVTVEGRTYRVDAAMAGSTLSLILGDPIRASYSIAIERGPAGELAVRLPDGTTAATIESPRKRRRRGDAGREHDGEETISAPMPGRVVRVLVAEGEQVAAGQAVVVVEAMKMENELRSPKGGRVKRVAVESGVSVEAGRPLVFIE
jgi:biotin carboxyl carrier protein